MKQVNIHQAKTQLSQLLADVENGEEVVIARAGKPIARLVAETAKPSTYRKGGDWAGKVKWDQAAWEAGDAEILEMFEESINRPLDVEPGR